MIRIAELKDEQTLGTLVKRLLAESSKKSPLETRAEMEAALLRLNPQLSRIRELKKGTAIMVPDEFGLASDVSVPASPSVADELLRQSAETVSKLRAFLKERVTESASENERMQTWLKSADAKEVLRTAPALKEPFANAVTAAKTLAKEKANALAAEDKALSKVQSQLKLKLK